MAPPHDGFEAVADLMRDMEAKFRKAGMPRPPLPDHLNPGDRSRTPNTGSSGLVW